MIGEDKFLCFGEHLGGDIRSNHLANIGCKFERRMPASCGDIQHQPTRLRISNLDQTVQIISLCMGLTGHISIGKSSETFL